MKLKRLLLVAIFIGGIVLNGCVASRDLSKIELEPVSNSEETVKIGDYKGKVVLIDYFATWCGPCKVIHPMLVELQGKLKGKDVVFISVTNETRKEVEKAGVGEGESIPVYLDTKMTLANQLGLEGVPTLVVLDRKGKIVKVQVGASETLDDLENAILDAL